LYDVFFRQSRKPNKTQSMAFNQTEYIFFSIDCHVKSRKLAIVRKITAHQLCYNLVVT